MSHVLLCGSVFNGTIMTIAGHLPDAAESQIAGAHDLHTLVRNVDDVARLDGRIGFGVPACVRMICECVGNGCDQ